MSTINEKKLHASRWKFAKKAFGNETYRGFRSMQISAFTFQISLERYGLNVLSFDYFIDRKSLYFEIIISHDCIKTFYKDARWLWSIPREDMPTHRNDYWIEKNQKPNVSDLYIEPANSNLVMNIKLNPKSKRYIYPTLEELMENEILVRHCSRWYFEEHLE